MPLLYALCPACDTCIAGPTPYQAHLDGQAQVHARVTGHAVEILDDGDPDEVQYVIPGEPGLFSG